jgi:hypothetical protein
MLMKLRVLPAVVATALCVSVLLVAEPASAVPAVPGISALDASTAGSVSGSVTSADPYVFVALSDGSSSSTKILVDLATSDDFSLTTWGYGAGASVQAWACPTGTFVDADCSAPASSPFSPKDVVPEVTWFEDTTVGPLDPDPVITVADPSGGGVLVARHAYGNVFSTTILEPGEPTSIPVVHAYWGQIDLQRCSAPDLVQCTAFSPGVAKGISVIKHLDFAIDQKVAASSTQDGSFRLQMVPELTGTATITWHLEDPAAPGIMVGSEHITTGAAQLYGYLPKVTVPRTGLAHGSYVVVGEVDFASGAEQFGNIDDQAFTVDPFLVDTIAPTLAVAANRSTIYPNVDTTKYPGEVIWIITGADHLDVGKAEVRSSTGTFAVPESVTKGTTKSVVRWDGLTYTSGHAKSVPTGYYKLMLWDKVGNPIAAKGVIKVDARRLVTKTWTKTVSASGSVEDQYVGRCSTLKRPVRGWTGSLGYYANTKCGTDTSAASLVSTLHAVTLPNVGGAYSSVRVSMYGGSASARPGSRGVIRYLTNSGKWTSETTVTSTMGHHSGLQRVATGMVYSDRSFAWGFYTAYGHRYDVKNFTVVVRYHALG